MKRDEILMHRKNKFLSIGRNQGFTISSKISDNLLMKKNIIDKFINNKKFLIYFIFLLLFIIILFSLS